MRKLKLRKTKIFDNITQLVRGRAKILSPSVCLQNTSLPPTGCCLQRKESWVIDYNHTPIPPPFHRPGMGVWNGHQENCLRHAYQWWQSWGWSRTLHSCWLEVQKPERCYIFYTAKGKDKPTMSVSKYTGIGVWQLIVFFKLWFFFPAS